MLKEVFLHSKCQEMHCEVKKFVSAILIFLLRNSQKAHSVNNIIINRAGRSAFWDKFLDNPVVFFDWDYHDKSTLSRNKI